MVPLAWRKTQALGWEARKVGVVMLEGSWVMRQPAWAVKSEHSRSLYTTQNGLRVQAGLVRPWHAWFVIFARPTQTPTLCISRFCQTDSVVKIVIKATTPRSC